MISIYNETKTPWLLYKNGDTDVVKISKLKERVHSVTKETKRRSLTCITYASLFDDISRTSDIMKTITQSKTITPIVDKKTAIIFNRKELKPFISERGEGIEKDILFASIFLAGRKVVHIRNNDAFFLDYFMLNSDFSFIASFNRPDAYLTIDLLDEAQDKVFTYVFTKENGTMKTTIFTRKKDEDKDSTDFKIRTFRPSKPTYTIITSKSDDNDALNTILKPDAHYVLHAGISETGDVLPDVVEKLKEEKYRAVTLFVNKPFELSEELDSEEIESIINVLKQQFYIVYKLYADNKIKKIKF